MHPPPHDVAAAFGETTPFYYKEFFGLLENGTFPTPYRALFEYASDLWSVSETHILSETVPLYKPQVCNMTPSQLFDLYSSWNEDVRATFWLELSSIFQRLALSYTGKGILLAEVPLTRLSSFCSQLYDEYKR